MMNDIPVFEFVGYQYGNFTARDTGEVRNYCQIFCLSDLSSSNGSFASGKKAEKFKCSSPDVFKNINFGDLVYLFCDRYGRVLKIDPVVHDTSASV